MKMCHLLLDSQTNLSSQHFQLPVSCPWVQHTVLKFVLSTTMLQTCVPNHICQPCCIFWLAVPSCAQKLCHGGQPWHVHCILGYIYAMHFVWQEPPPRDDEAWSTQPNDCQLCFNFSFRLHLTLQHQLNQQRLVHQTKWLGT